MTWLKRTLPALLLSWALAAPAAAQIAGRPLEFSAGAGIFAYDTRTRLNDGFALTGSAGWRAATWLTLEASGTFGSSTTDFAPERDASFFDASLDARLNARPAHDAVVPYAIVGFGLGHSSIKGLTPEALDRGAPSLGAGTLFSLRGSQRAYLRLQVRDVMFRDRGAKEFGHNVAATVALHYVLGGKQKDTDLDGVRDWLDRCPETPIGATVDATGCPKDSDGDAVLDGIDKCPDTPKGAKVDKKDCSIDADADGVADGIDTCPDTPKGAKVDSKGCPIDSDGDGIFDGLDQCPDTPKGAKIDDNGCPKDADADGVPDGIDTCPDTPKGAQVDPIGCETQASKLEAELLDTGRIRAGIAFTDGGTAVAPEGAALADAVGQVLAKWPEAKVEVGAHTDDRLPPARAKQLADAQADAVRKYLLEKYALQPAQLVAKGYGSSRPVISLETDAARAINRRIEFRVLNPAVLRATGGARRLGAK